MVDVDGACPGSLLDVDDEVEKMAFISPGGPLDHRILLPKKGIRSGISGSKVVWVHFLSTSFEDAEGWALTYTGSGPELVHFVSHFWADFGSVHFGSLTPHFGPLRPTRVTSLVTLLTQVAAHSASTSVWRASGGR